MIRAIAETLLDTIAALTLIVAVVWRDLFATALLLVVLGVGYLRRF